MEPKWNLCDAPGGDNGGKVDAVKKFLESNDKVLVCTHATFRFAVDKFGLEVLDDRLIAVDEFHYVSANLENKFGDHVRQLMTCDKTHLIAMTGSYFRGDAEAVLPPEDEFKFDTITYTCCRLQVIFAGPGEPDTSVMFNDRIRSFNNLAVQGFG